MGLLRVLLAIAVLLSHTGLVGGRVLVDGPMAVQLFYIVSGFYIGLVLNERYNRPELNRVFYINRLARIFPVYFAFLAFYVILFLILQWKTGSSPLWPYRQDTVSTGEKVFLGLLNITVIGQDITFFTKIVGGHLAWTDAPFQQGGREVYHFIAVPMAWSLALELYFYAIAPFVARRPVRQIATLMGMSSAARIIAALLGFSADPLSYRFFPFELALFLAGVLGYKAWAANPGLYASKWAKSVALAALAAVMIYPQLLGSWSRMPFFTPARVGTLVLVACALPVIHEWSRKIPLDRRVGELSFPLYLGHLLVLGLIPQTGHFADHPVTYLLVVTAISLVLSWIVVRFIESRIEGWRRQNAAQAGAAEKRPSMSKQNVHAAGTMPHIATLDPVLLQSSARESLA